MPTGPLKARSAPRRPRQTPFQAVSLRSFQRSKAGASREDPVSGPTPQRVIATAPHSRGSLAVARSNSCLVYLSRRSLRIGSGNYSGRCSRAGLERPVAEVAARRGSAFTGRPRSFPPAPQAAPVPAHGPGWDAFHSTKPCSTAMASQGAVPGSTRLPHEWHRRKQQSRQKKTEANRRLAAATR